MARNVRLDVYGLNMKVQPFIPFFSKSSLAVPKLVRSRASKLGKEDISCKAALVVEIAQCSCCENT
jgi:hypothetical protein